MLAGVLFLPFCIATNKHNETATYDRILPTASCKPSVDLHVHTGGLYHIKQHTKLYSTEENKEQNVILPYKGSVVSTSQ